jgi:hypothetical protein
LPDRSWRVHGLGGATQRLKDEGSDAGHAEELLESLSVNLALLYSRQSIMRRRGWVTNRV